MKINVLFLLSLVLIGCHDNKRLQAQQPPSHELLDQILSRYVVNDVFNYRGLLKDSVKLNNYLLNISNQPPADHWTKEEKLAYWINAYNAYTLKLIIDNYPLESITDLHPTIHIPLLNTVWLKKFFSFGGEPTSLDEIEHKILRKEFNEPRIHFAINCASTSCPPLRNEAFKASVLESQLEEQTRVFINDIERNEISPANPKVSKIFSWFSGDFKKEQTIIQFINRYSEIQINEDADIDYMKYNWGLNDLP